MTTSTDVKQVKLNVMTEQQYLAAEKSSTELYMVTDAKVDYDTEVKNKPEGVLSVFQNGIRIAQFSASSHDDINASIDVPVMHAYMGSASGENIINDQRTLIVPYANWGQTGQGTYGVIKVKDWNSGLIKDTENNTQVYNADFGLINDRNNTQSNRPLGMGGIDYAVTKALTENAWEIGSSYWTTSHQALACHWLGAATRNMINPNVTEWDREQSYNKGDRVIHDGNYYEAKSFIIGNRGWIASDWKACDIQGQIGTLDSLTTTKTNLVAAINEIDSHANTNTGDIESIEAKIPEQASYENQLADKDFVNSSISTNTANYISNNGEPFASLEDLENYSGTVSSNDYAFVVDTDAAGNTVYKRYKWNGSAWAHEYDLNNSSFTSNQWAAINSNATTENIAQITTNQNAIGTLSNLTTEAQTDLVSAINELDAKEIPSSADDISYSNPSYPTVAAALDQLLYVKPTVSISGGGTYEDGRTLSSVTLNWSTNKTITSQSLNQGIGSLDASIRTYTYSYEVSTDKTFTITVNDGKNNASSSTSVSFRNKKFYGISDKDTLTDAEIKALASSEWCSSKTMSKKTFNCTPTASSPNGFYIYYALPSSFVSGGDPTFKINGLQTTAYLKTVKSDYQNGQNKTVSYTIYRFMADNKLTTSYELEAV